MRPPAWKHTDFGRKIFLLSARNKLKFRCELKALSSAWRFFSYFRSITSCLVPTGIKNKLVLRFSRSLQKQCQKTWTLQHVWLQMTMKLNTVILNHKVCWRTDTFSNTGRHKFLMSSTDLNMAPLVARHTSTWYLVSLQVLASVSLVTHAADLTILSRDSFTFWNFSR